MAPAGGTGAAVELADLEGAVERTVLPGQTKLAGLGLGYRKGQG